MSGIRVGVVGAGGKMGSAVCAAVAADPQLELVAAVDPHAVGQLREGVSIAAEPRALVDAGCNVAVDFTVADASRTTLAFLALHGIHAVVGTTGFTDDDLARFASDFSASNCLIAANFSVSAVLMMRFAELAAPWFDTAEIIELHHDQKVDSPSGTALATADRMAAARGHEWAADQTRHEVVAGARGAVGPGGLRMHSVRMRGMVAHQEVILGAAGQTLTIRHDSYDRLGYMPGVLLACRRIDQFPGLTVGLDRLLDL